MEDEGEWPSKMGAGRASVSGPGWALGWAVEEEREEKKEWSAAEMSSRSSGELGARSSESAPSESDTDRDPGGLSLSESPGPPGMMS